MTQLESNSCASSSQAWGVTATWNEDEPYNYGNQRDKISTRTIARKAQKLLLAKRGPAGFKTYKNVKSLFPSAHKIFFR